MSDATKESQRLYKRLEPSLSSPKKIRSAIKQFEDLINNIREDLGPIADNSTNNSGPGVTKSRKSNQRIKINHKFRDKVVKRKSHNFKGFLEFLSITHSIPDIRPIPLTSPTIGISYNFFNSF